MVARASSYCSHQGKRDRESALVAARSLCRGALQREDACSSCPATSLWVWLPAPSCLQKGLVAAFHVYVSSVALKVLFLWRLTNETGAGHWPGFRALRQAGWAAPGRSLPQGVQQELWAPALQGRSGVLLCVCRVLSAEGPWSLHSLRALL